MNMVIPTSFLHCFDEDGEICAHTFFAYTRKLDDDEENAALVQKGRSKRRMKKRHYVMIEHDGVSLLLTPKTSVFFHMYINSPVVDDDFYKLFKLRFRLPYQVFNRLLQDIKIHHMFSQWHDTTDSVGTASTPIELLLLASLRILGRDWKLDDFHETIGVGYGTVRRFFHIFCEYGATILKKKYLKSTHTDDELHSTMQLYSKLGLNGCVGSMDATHIQSCRIPSSLSHAHSSYKLNHPARSYNVTVDHSKKIIHTTRGFPGRYNDQTVVRYDELFCGISDETLGKGCQFWLYYYDQDSETVKVQNYKGCWLLVDGGYIERPVLVCPMKHTIYKDEHEFSKWVESVRKDVECTFGILKQRFSIFRTPIRYHSIEHMDNIWITCCSLHNMLLDENNSDASEYIDERLQETQRQAAIDIIASREIDITVVNEHESAVDPTYPNGIDIIPVNKLTFEDFRNRLIKHFIICKQYKTISWS